MSRVLLTGAAGFSGSHIAKVLIERGYDVLSLDCYRSVGRLDRLAHLPPTRLTALYHDFTCPLSEQLLEEIGAVKYIIHCGAETHVPRSFENPEPFVQANVIGTLNMLEAARRLKPAKFIYISTDEVFGPSFGHNFTESEALNPSNPYSATKAAGELLAYSYFRSFSLPVIVTRTMNMFGERQDPEKMIPMTVKKVLAGEVVDIHANEGGYVGSRSWLHARTQADALCFLLEHGKNGESYNISGTKRSNLEIAESVSRALGKTIRTRVVDAYSKWPSHDLDYNIDDSKIRELGWEPKENFEQALYTTIRWTADNPQWLTQ